MLAYFWTYLKEKKKRNFIYQTKVVWTFTELLHKVMFVLQTVTSAHSGYLPSHVTLRNLIIICRNGQMLLCTLTFLLDFLSLSTSLHISVQRLFKTVYNHASRSGLFKGQSLVKNEIAHIVPLGLDPVNVFHLVATLTLELDDKADQLGGALHSKCQSSFLYFFFFCFFLFLCF